MPETKIVRPGGLFFLTELGIKQTISPSSPIQKIESLSVGSFGGHLDQRWSLQSFKGFNRTPTIQDAFLLLKDYTWISVEASNCPGEPGLELGNHSSVYYKSFRSAALFITLFGDRKVAFAIWLKEDQVLDQMIWTRKVSELAK